jgi:hypothetical protein
MDQKSAQRPIDKDRNQAESLVVAETVHLGSWLEQSKRPTNLIEIRNSQVEGKEYLNVKGHLNPRTKQHHIDEIMTKANQDQLGP